MSKKASRTVANTLTGTSTFLFTDTGGSTSLYKAFPERMYTARERHDENE